MGEKKVLVIGVGNLLLQDEGVGVHVARELMGRELPSGVEVFDGGTSIMDLLPVIQEAERIIVIDALRGGEKPGTVYRLTSKDLEARGERSLSLHQVGLLESLDLVERLGSHPEVVIFGVEPGKIDWGMEMGWEVQAKVPKVIELVYQELEK